MWKEDGGSGCMEAKLVREPRGSKSGQMGLGWDIAVGLGDQLAEAGRGEGMKACQALLTRESRRAFGNGFSLPSST